MQQKQDGVYQLETTDTEVTSSGNEFDHLYAIL